MTRLRAFPSCLCPIAGGPLTVVGCFGPIGRRPISVSLGSQESILVARAGVIVEVVEPCEFVATGRAAIAKVRGPIAVVGPPQPRSGRFVAQRRHQVTVAG